LIVDARPLLRWWRPRCRRGPAPAASLGLWQRQPVLKPAASEGPASSGGLSSPILLAGPRAVAEKKTARPICVLGGPGNTLIEPPSAKESHDEERLAVPWPSGGDAGPGLRLQPLLLSPALFPPQLSRPD